jgi:protein subunit release factor B
MYRINTIRHSLPCLGVRTKFTLDPDDLVIQNVIGSGPGGTKMASTRNKVVVKHVPTNIVVQCHKTRFLDQNRRIAIEQLTDKVEFHLYGTESSVAKKREKNLEGYAERKQAIKEESQKRIAADRQKREEAQAARKQEIERVMSTGLPYLRDNLQNESSEMEEGEELSDSTSSDSVDIFQDISPPDTKIFRDKSMGKSQDSLKSMFGAPRKK